MDMDSVSSFGGPKDKELLRNKPTQRHAWVNHENFQRMLDEYRAAKASEKSMCTKIKQLSAQLARTEEAAKRALVQSDPSAKGGAAQKLLDAERTANRLREENADLTSKLAREKKRAHDFRSKSDELGRRLTRTLQEQRALVEQLGRENSKAGMRKEGDPSSEASKRRFIQQQEELVALREDNAALKQQLSDGQEQGTVQQLQNDVYELQQQIAWYQSKDTMQAAGTANDWLLDEVRHGSQVYLLDATSNKVFSFAVGGQQPQPVGRYIKQQVQLGSDDCLEDLLAALDQHLVAARERLADMWKKFDKNASGALERHELRQFLLALLPNCSEKSAEELLYVLDASGDEKVTMDELLSTAASVVQSRHVLRVGSATGELQRVRNVLRGSIPQLNAAVQSELTLRQAVDEVCKLVPGTTVEERRLVLLRLHMWDVHGLNRIMPLDLLAALGLRKPIIRRHQSAANHESQAVPSNSMMGVLDMDTRSSDHKQNEAPLINNNHREAWAPQSVRPPQISHKPVEDMYVKERMARLELELQAARKKAADNRTDAALSAKLRAELSDTKARLQELQADMLAFDPATLEHADTDNDAMLKQLRGQVIAYRKRFSEGHAELEELRSMHSRVVEQLEATHAALESEQKARFSSEDEAGRLKLELQNLKAIQEALTMERNARMKLEREVLSLQSRALAAPSSALEEVRGLREDLFRSAREKAAAEQREAELRRQVNNHSRQGASVTLAEHEKLQETLGTAQRRLVTTELELQAAREKLEVYRRTDIPQALGMDVADTCTPQDAFPSGLVADACVALDGGKLAEELRRELQQLRAVYMSAKADLDKVRKLLQHESEVVLEAKACEEAMRCEVEAIRVDTQQQVAALRRQKDSQEEQIRKLEIQLKAAYSGLGKVVRSSHVMRTSIGGASQDTEALKDLAPGENLFELTVTDAVLEEQLVSKDAPTFLTLDFFMHETQSTSVAGGTRPMYDTTLQYVVEADRFFLEHLATASLSMELCEAQGMDYVVLGSACLPLKLLLEDLRLGTATTASKAVHHVDITGPQGQHLGRVRLLLSFKLPVDQVLLKDFGQAMLMSVLDNSGTQDQAIIAAKKAAERPAAAEHVRVLIQRCSALQSSQTGSAPAVYAHYRFPGFDHAHDTQVEHSSEPEFNDECMFPMVRSKDLDAHFSTRKLEVVVFDDNGGDSPQHSIIGVVQVPLSGLSGGHKNSEHRLQLRHPITKELSGYIELRLEWCNLSTLVPPSTKDAAQPEGLDTGLSAAAHKQQRQQLSHPPAGPGQSFAASITAVLDAQDQHSSGNVTAPQLGGFTVKQAPFDYGGASVSATPPKPHVKAAPNRFSLDSVPQRGILDINVAATPNHAATFGLLAELG